MNVLRARTVGFNGVLALPGPCLELALRLREELFDGWPRCTRT
ncbi:hypothetical protein [Pseudofrankia inefficax]|uniref:Uncharacterized protein n=1 Tax=Pseudofrankia inefficax (strain DSM 45817 / CECT 9037 / DDB 130130 / EuI1c) TaxID=298654 RepID=E3J6J4_PSEI1|nr:hypothetical protein [Pseudofrankia inefficax]ADP80770.1 hypothetical protein FraEuI1c_2739 [Pseudofrankia inefficax]